MEWVLGFNLESADLISEFEREVGYSFCDSFKKTVMSHNGSNVVPDCFDTDETEGHVFNVLLSFNKEDICSIWRTARYWDDGGIGMRDAYVVFADSPFGDFIAFDKRNDSVVFIDHETLHVEKIADDFDGFLNCLYEDPDDDDFEFLLDQK